MKKISILTLMMTFMAMSIFAQTARTYTPAVEKSAKKVTDEMKAQLKLTPDQYAKILTINKDFYTQTDGMNAPGKEMTSADKVKLSALTRVKDDQINTLLTAEQRAKRSGK